LTTAIVGASEYDQNGVQLDVSITGDRTTLLDYWVNISRQLLELPQRILSTWWMYASSAVACSKSEKENMDVVVQSTGDLQLHDTRQPRITWMRWVR
jgi:hypothetical protein